MRTNNWLSVFLKELTNDPEEEEGEEESDRELNEDDSTKQEPHTVSYKETIKTLLSFCETQNKLCDLDQ